MVQGMATDKARLVAYCSPEVKEKLERLAELRFRSVSNLIEVLVVEEVTRAETSGELPPKKSD